MKRDVWLLRTGLGIAPVNKLVSLTWLLWALRSFRSFTLNYITSGLSHIHNEYPYQRHEQQNHGWNPKSVQTIYVNSVNVLITGSRTFPQPQEKCKECCLTINNSLLTRSWTDERNLGCVAKA